MTYIRCLELLAVVLLGVGILLPTSVSAQSFNYDEDCISNIKNATVYVSSTDPPTLPTGRPLEKNDTLAVYTKQGTCAGFGVWEEKNGLTFLAAGPKAIDSIPNEIEGASIPKGFEEGEKLKFEVFDVSKDTALTLDTNVQYAPCGEAGIVTCRDGGTYTDDTVHQIVGFASSSGDPSTSSDEAYVLKSVHPNPAQTETFVQYRLPEEADVQIRLFDILGRHVADIVETTQSAGLHRARLETSDLSSGVYFLRIRANSFQDSQRLSIVR